MPPHPESKTGTYVPRVVRIPYLTPRDFIMSRPVRCTVVLLVMGACGLPTRDSVDLAQTVNEIGVVVQEMQNTQADLYARMDSLSLLVARQDSMMRNMANLMGAPLPPR